MSPVVAFARAHSTAWAMSPFGTMAACRGVAGVHPLDVVRGFFADAPYPVGIGLPAGHDPAPGMRENHALPLGVRVRLDTHRGRLVALEPAVV